MHAVYGIGVLLKFYEAELVVFRPRVFFFFLEKVKERHDERAIPVAWHASNGGGCEVTVREEPPRLEGALARDPRYALIYCESSIPDG